MAQALEYTACAGALDGMDPNGASRGNIFLDGFIMTEEKRSVLEKLERMKDGAEKTIAAGSECYMLHAECALKFAEEAIAFLAKTEEKEKKPGVTLRKPNGEVVEIETECVSIQAAKPIDGGYDVTVCNQLVGSVDALFALTNGQAEAQDLCLKVIAKRLKKSLDELFSVDTDGDGDESK